ncbi:response regulator [Ectobacillus funiculus]|uniref:response regulator n=1 Tax=Ectobacillus funiculus TaxID=137993 RepID=UPI00397E22F7
MLKVLLADDEPIILRGLKKIIPWESYGFEIIGDATNGVDLLETAKEKLPDLIISDICMPGLSGMDVIQHAKKLNLKTKFIFVSAFSDSALIKAAKDYGAHAYLVKPIKKDELEQAVLKAIV